MTERELRKLRRSDLLEMLLEQSRELEQLRTQLAQTQERLDNRDIAIQNAGSLAEASLQLSGVFEAAEQACEKYLYNIRFLSENQEEACARIELETLEKCARMEEEAANKCDQMLRDARDQCDRMLADARKKAPVYREVASSRVREMNQSYALLRDKLAQTSKK